MSHNESISALSCRFLQLLLLSGTTARHLLLCQLCPRVLGSSSHVHAMASGHCPAAQLRKGYRVLGHRLFKGHIHAKHGDGCCWLRVSLRRHALLKKVAEELPGEQRLRVPSSWVTS